MSSGAACPFRSSPNSGLYTAARSDIAESVTSDPGRCSMPSTTMISTTKRTCSKMRPRCHVCPPNCLGITTERRRSADAARRSWWAHRRAWTGTRSHVWAAMDNRCRSDPPPATPELRSVAQDLTMPGPPRLMDRMGGDVDIEDERPGTMVSGARRCSGERTIR